jgi:hypothetical protein
VTGPALAVPTGKDPAAGDEVIGDRWSLTSTRQLPCPTDQASRLIRHRREFDFFFTVPYDRFTISRSADVTTFALLLAVGVAVSQLAAWARRLKAVTVADAGYFTRIVSSAALTQQAGTPYEVVEHVRRQLIDVLGLQDCRFEYGKLLGQPPRLEQDGSIRTRYGHYPVDLSGLPAEEVELRTFSNGQYAGRFMLTPKPGARPSQRARLVAVALADLAGHAVGDGSAHAA